MITEIKLLTGDVFKADEDSRRWNTDKITWNADEGVYVVDWGKVSVRVPWHAIAWVKEKE